MITKIKIDAGQPAWGEPVNLEEHRKRLAFYTRRAAQLLGAAFPDVEIMLTFRRDDGGDRITFTDDTDENGLVLVCVEDAAEARVRDALGQAWQDACEQGMPQVYDYETGEPVTEGRASAALVEASRAERSGTGATLAVLDGDEWRPIEESAEHLYAEIRGEKVRTVYVKG